MNGLDWLQFPDTHRFRPTKVREILQANQIIQTDATSGATTLPTASILPPLPQELKNLLPLILKAADTLERHQQQALTTAEAAKIGCSLSSLQTELNQLTA
jgi:hypothetical protein